DHVGWITLYRSTGWQTTEQSCGECKKRHSPYDLPGYSRSNCGGVSSVSLQRKLVGQSFWSICAACHSSAKLRPSSGWRTSGASNESGQRTKAFFSTSGRGNSRPWKLPTLSPYIS